MEKKAEKGEVNCRNEEVWGGVYVINENLRSIRKEVSVPKKERKM